ncbi:hypothetical protein ABVG11_15135 [Streptomyces sp. HD1123-B1]|uniref:hypothetical protein n=1 Tax=Streptomyces huangiella TaxID=3228804 RepID=UPI003D7EDFB8
MFKDTKTVHKPWISETGSCFQMRCTCGFSGTLSREWRKARRAVDAHRKDPHRR